MCILHAMVDMIPDVLCTIIDMISAHCDYLVATKNEAASLVGYL